MGLGMNQNAKLATLLISFLILSNCSEKPKEELSPLGTKTSAAEVSKALDDASSDTHIYYAKAGQFVSYDSNYKVDLSDPIRVSTVLRTYKGFLDQAERFVFQLDESYYEYSRNQSITHEKHSEVNLEMKKAIQSLIDDEECGPVREDSDGNKFDCLRYYNLKIKDEVVKAPAAAAQRANCSNIPNCELKTRVIEFDQVKFLGDKQIKKEIFKFSISKQIPVLLPDRGFPPINYFCISQVYSENYFVTQCTYLTDLRL